MAAQSSSRASGGGTGGAAPVSLRQVAGAAGVSRMTVSRAFKPGASIRPEVRTRVLAVARELGYAPDQMVTELMTSFVKRRLVKYRETFAALWWPERWAWQRTGIGLGAAMRRGLEKGAARHGCAVEHTVLAEKMSARSLMRMLKARGIRGLILTPPVTAETTPPALDWNDFSVVIMGSSLRSPRLHRAQASHYAAMVGVLETVKRRGYRRPCLLVRIDLEERMQRAYAGAFLAWEPDGAERIWHASAPETPGLKAWMEKTRPDVVIADTDGWRTVLPPTMGEGAFVSLAVEDPAGPITGNYQNFERVAESSVDLLAQARLRHETGEPAEPLIMLTTGFWVEGSSLRR